MHIHAPEVVVLAATLLTMVKCQNSTDASKNKIDSDENRPYEFGFNIDGYQHRHEKKDANGIIMGEFGFITGDGVYHITVYATDENGNFKILKMKNVYIGLPQENPTTAASLVSGSTAGTDPITNMPASTTEGLAGCAGCVVPIKMNSESPGSSSAAGPNQPPASLDPSGQVDPPSKKPHKKPIFQKPSLITSERLSTLPQTPGAGNAAMKSSMGGDLKQDVMGTSKPNIPGNDPLMNTLNEPNKDQKPIIPQQMLIQMLEQAMKDKNPSQIQETGDNVTQDGLSGLLYKFNYTLTYNGHNEIGDRNGSKTGGYFSNGRDGVGVQVNYLANEFGYQPNITFKNLTDAETPNPETEKDNNELKGYEFKWFYSE